MIYFTSDQHFFHDNVIKYCDRPFSSVEEMNAIISRNYCEVVGVNDLVMFLGDISIKRGSKYKAIISELVKSLPGHKILIRGNHDQYTNTFYREECGFLESVRIKRLEHMVLTHNPLDFTEEDSGKYLIHGHSHCPVPVENFSHTGFLSSQKVYDVGVDANNYYPISLDYVIKELDR